MKKYKGLFKEEDNSWEALRSKLKEVNDFRMLYIHEKNGSPIVMISNGVNIDIPDRDDTIVLSQKATEITIYKKSFTDWDLQGKIIRVFTKTNMFWLK